MAKVKGRFGILEQLSSKHFPLITISSYLEIGVNEGLSLQYVLSVWDIDDLVLCDTWLDEYGGANRGSNEHIVEMLQNYTINNVTFLDGDSKIKIPEYFATFPEKSFDMIFVDGDHSGNGLWQDLMNTCQHANILVAHDIRHPGHAYLKEVCRAFYETVREAFILFDDGLDVNMLIRKEIFYE